MDQPAEAATTARPGPAATIFLVDDSADVGDMLVVLLGKAGYVAHEFNDPLRALEALEAADPKPQLLVTDFRMPGINGLELMRRSKLIHPELKIISASGHMPQEQVAKYTVQPDRFLPKPYTSAKLLELVKELLAE
jgi:CheY-like chemotaxis protein